MDTDSGDRQSFVSALEQLDVHDHACLIYDSRGEQFAAIIPFIKIGLTRSEKCIYVADDNTSEEVLAAMLEAGIDVDDALATGALSVITKRDTYLKQGFFDPEWMIGFLATAAKEAVRDGYRALRVTGEMTWVLGDDPGTERLFEYEAKLDYFFPENEILGIWQYNRDRFDPATLVEVVETCPTVIYGTTVCRNLRYIPPDVLLASEAARKEAELQSLLSGIVERERTEQALAESRDHLASIIRDTGAGYFRVDREGRLEEVNAAWLKLHGYSSPEEVIGKHLSVTQVNGYVETAREDVERLMSGEHLPTGELSRRRKDGSVGYHSFSASPVTSGGKVVGFEGFLVDTTEHTLAEQADKVNAAMLETAAEGIYVIGLDDLIIKWANRRFEEMFGYDPGEMVGMHVDHVNAPTDKTPTETRISIVDVLRETGQWRGEVENIKKDGTHFWCHASVSAFDHPAFGRAGISAHTDITDTKLAEEALRASEERFRGIFEQGAVGIAIADTDTRFVRANDAFCRMLGYEEDELVGQAITAITADEDVQASSMGLRDLHAGGDALQSLDKRYIRKDGSLIWGHLSASLLRDATGKPVGSVAVVEDITERKKAEQALRESQERYRQIVETANEGIWVMDAEHRTAFANDRMGEMLGYSPQAMTGRRVSDFMLEEDLEDHRIRMQNRESGIDEKYDRRFRHSDGSVIWCHLGAMPLKDERGEFAGSFAMLEDITERKKAEEALRESEQRLTDITFSMADWVWEVDENGVYTYSSRSGSQLLGLPDEAIIGKTPFDFMPPDEARRVAAIFSEVAADKAPIKDLENWNVRKNGERICLLTSGAPLLDEVGNLKGYRGVDKDITERKRAENALADSEKRYRRLVESSPDGIVIESEGKIVYANQTAARILGASGTDQLVGTPYLELVEPAYRKAVSQIVEACSPLERVPTVETRLRSVQGRPIDVDAAFILMSYDGVPAVDIIFHDITERKQIEQVKSDFIATVSHELRSPLAVILGFATFLEQNAGDPSRREDTERAARAIHDRGSFMKSLVESLLEMSHIQSGDFSLSLDSLDLGGLLAAAARAVPLTDWHTLELKVSSRIGQIVCDPRRLSIAVSNLVANAVKFSPEGGVVRVAAKRKNGRAIVSVSDEGIGISRHDQAHIFDRFTQADMSSTRRFSGTGMGLYIARQIVDAHRGALSVRSKLGEGSTFTIDIPVAQDKPASDPLRSVAS